VNHKKKDERIHYLAKTPQPASLLLGCTLAGCLVFIGCSPAQSAAGNSVDPKLKEQVLQIIRENPQAILDSVQAYQQQQQQSLKAAQESFLQEMKTNPKSAIGDSPSTGSASQQIVLLEFSDFQCPFCARAHDTVKQFMAKHQDKVTLAYKHFPLTSIHPQALPAAKAAWAAQQQGKFWEYYSALFEGQKQLGEPLYASIAQKLNLKLDKFNTDRNSPACRSRHCQRRATRSTTGHSRDSLLYYERSNFVRGGRAF
jgi:protein-disulfide isomerase